MSERLRVTKAKVISFVQQSLSFDQIISEDLHFKRSKGAPQRKIPISSMGTLRG